MDVSNSRRAMLGFAAALPLIAAAPSIIAYDPATAGLHAGLEAYNGRIAAYRQSGDWPDDAELEAVTEAGWDVVGRIAALPNTPENLRLRALAIGAAVDNTHDLHNLDLGELAAHAEGDAGRLVRQVLACIMGGAA